MMTNLIGFSFNPFPLRMHEEYEQHFFAEMVDEEDHPLWKRERIEFKSVGIDIGSSTSHLMFSRLIMRRMGTNLSSRFVVVNREIIWKSEVLLTPYINHSRIDVPRLSKFIDHSYRAAGLVPDSIDTGAVIITGEASRKENAEALTKLFAMQVGKFVCATAGPNLEAMMAAYGSGAVRYSMEGAHDRTVMVVDVGGGTSKIALVQGGIIRETAATNVGGRLVAMDKSGRIMRIEEAGEWIAEKTGINLKLGSIVTEQEKDVLSERLADLLFETLERRMLSPLAKKLMITPPLVYAGKIDTVMFSGGVGEYIYGAETRDYQDLGRLLGIKIIARARKPGFGIQIEMPDERIRATVIGASQYTVQVSGNTILVSDKKVLPLRNLKVIFPRIEEATLPLTALSVEEAIGQAFSRFDLKEGEEPVALAFHWPFDPQYDLLWALSTGIVDALPRTIAGRITIVLIFNVDIGKTIGNLLRNDLHVDTNIVSFDQIHLHDFDYIDIGEIVEEAEAVPVVVKSLVFGREAEDSSQEMQLRKRHIH